MRQAVTVVLLAAAVGTGCGDSSAGNSPDPAAVAAAKAQPSGDTQSGTVGQDLSNPLRIVVVRGGTPEAGAVVSWTAAGTGASMTPRVDTTAADGISTSIWHLGSEVGMQTAQASVAGGADGAPVRFTANAQGPGGQQNGVEIKLLTSGGNRFDPANVTVPVGTKVTWTWVGGFHDVTPTGGFAGSGGPVLAPHSFSQTFNSPGTFLYFCSVHGSPTGGMRGTIVVQ